MQEVQTNPVARAAYDLETAKYAYERAAATYRRQVLAEIKSHPFFQHRNRGRKRGRNPNCKWCGRPREDAIHEVTDG